MDYLSGGDYDGDRVWITQNPLFINHFKPFKSKNIVGVAQFISDGKAKNINEVYKEWINRIYEVGKICSYHTSLSDKYGINYYKCEILSELCYISVDSKKSGKIITFPNEFNGRFLYPHYIDNHDYENTRKSTSVLGIMYDIIKKTSKPFLSFSNKEYFDRESYKTLYELSKNKIDVNDTSFIYDILEYNKALHNHIMDNKNCIINNI